MKWNECFRRSPAEMSEKMQKTFELIVDQLRHTGTRLRATRLCDFVSELFFDKEPSRIGLPEDLTEHAQVKKTSRNQRQVH
jgi:hypothetical protein